MPASRLFLLLSAAFAICLPASSVRAEVRLPKVFGSHMVLQEGRPVPFWGTARPGERITVSAAGAHREAVAGSDGRWRIELPAFERREPFTVTVRGDDSVTFDDVVTGEVWLASGQSNMEWEVVRARDGDREAARARDARLRLFLVRHNHRLAATPGDVNGSWVVADPRSVADFSAVGYFFARALRGALDRPVGVIASSWGGTPAEAWTSRAALAADPALRHYVGAGKKGRVPSETERAAAVAAYERAVAEWERQNSHADPGNAGAELGFAQPGHSGEGFARIELPGHWEERAGLAIDGAVWFRKEVEIPAAWAGKALTLSLGVLNDCDVAYFDGVQVGATCKDTPGGPGASRAYVIPAARVRPGRRIVAVRVFDERGRGGFSSGASSLRLSQGDADDAPSIALAGRWYYRVERALPPIEVRWDTHPVAPPEVPTSTGPGHLWEQLIAPMVPFAIRGVIWYQGEANVDRAWEYRTLFPAMIKDWRRAWGQGEFPFLYVQLAAFHPRWAGPGHRSEDEWAELREAQLRTLLAPATGMAVAIDVGDRDDIHPTNKQEVGRRLALVALEKVYGQKVESSGPTFIGMKVEGAKVRLRFSHAEGLGASGPAASGVAPPKDSPIVGFEIAGPDRRFVLARAEVEGDTVVVSAPNVEKPVAVRYAWTDSPVCNLVNGAGLPASPFRTDTFPAFTEHARVVPTSR